MSRPRSGPPACHPNRPYLAMGLCAECYRHARTDGGRLERFHSLPANDPGRFLALHAYLDRSA